MFYVPTAVLWIFSEHVFLALGQSSELSRDSAWFLTCLIPGGLGYIYLEIMKKYLQAQGIMQPGTYVLLITSPISALLNYQFIAIWGIFAAPVATGIGYWLSFLGLLVYTKYVVGTEHWGGWSRRCFHNLGIFSRLAFLGIVQTGTEWLACEITALAAGRLGEVALASQSILLTTTELLYTIPLGVGVVATARVGNFLGMRDIGSAWRSSALAVFIGVLTSLILLVTLISTRSILAKLFTMDEAVIQLTAQTLPFVALTLVTDGLSQSTGGILRAMGRQHLGAVINIVGYYCIGLPLGLLLAFKSEWGLRGIWTGTFIGLSSVGLLQLAVVALSDWQDQVDGAFSRMDQATSARNVGDIQVGAAERAV